MIKVTNIKAVRLLGVLLILLSGDAFAVRVYATQDGLDTEISNRKSGDSTEKARATKAEGALKTADTAEKAARITGDSTEKTRATKVEGTLNKAIATEVTNRNTAIAAEATRATGVEGTLSTAITAETTARDTAIGAEVTNRNTAIATEATRATGVEGTLSTAITAETTARDTAIGSAIATEVTNRNTAIATETARAKAAEPPVLIPGDSYQGGIVFWVDQTGQHGLIAAKADQSAGVSWYDSGVASAYRYNNTGTTGDGIYAGIANTTKIVAQQNALSTQASIANSSPLTLVASAAQIADDYSIQEGGVQGCTGAVSETCYGDWYLPSKFELNLLYAQKSVVGGFASNYYWSSTEYYSDYAWLQNFLNGSQDFNHLHKNATNRVRAVRAF